MNEWLSSSSWLWTLSSLNWPRYQLLSSSVGWIRGFPSPYIIFPLIPGGKERLREPGSRESQPGTRAQNAVDSGDNTGHILGNPCGPFVEAFRTQRPRQQTRPSEDKGGRARGRGHRGGPSLGGVARHKGDSREAAAGADLRSPATRSCGYRPAAPLPLPTQARPPARLPARLSVSSLPPYWTARVHFRAPEIWYRSVPGAREQVAAAGWLGCQPGTPGRVSGRLCRQPFRGGRSSPRSARCRPDFAPRRALLLRAGPRLWPAAAR